MSIEAVSRNSPITSAATMSSAQNREIAAVKSTALQADQAETITKRRQAEQPIAQAVINAQGQPTGTLINIIA